MHYDAIIIGAGMSGLAAGIRLAYFDQKVCIVEKHYAFGGLNSYYRLHGRSFDVGLHAVTNFASSARRDAPLSRLLRQLRLSWDDFDLKPQRYSEIRFPDRRLRFNNDPSLLSEQVFDAFPAEADRFRQMIRTLEAFRETDVNPPSQLARTFLRDHLKDPLLIEMLLCPVMFYGSAQEHDMEFVDFATIFKSVFLEGFGRPREGVRRIIAALVRKFRGCGGELRMRCGVARLLADGRQIVGVRLETGEEITSDVVLSSAGFVETMRLCGEAEPEGEQSVGRLSFVESIAILDVSPLSLGHEATIVFFSRRNDFRYARPSELVDESSGIVCCPSNYLDHEGQTENAVRMTWLASYEGWCRLSEDEYADRKRHYVERFIRSGQEFVPRLADHIVCTDLFTPRTIERYTGHLGGAVYGSPKKWRDGRTRFDNLFLCGTDQGFLGIVGAMLSGITMANRHVLSGN